jgi:hypothetical protein
MGKATDRRRYRHAGGPSKVGKMSEAHQKAVDDNLDFFLGELPNLQQTNLGKFALLHNRTIVGFYDTPLDAASAGNLTYPDKLFSIQQVTDVPVDLGYYSHASSMGKA